MRKWQAHASLFTPLVLTFTFTLTLTLIFIPSTLAQADEPEQLGGEEELEKCKKEQERSCTTGFTISFTRQQLTCDQKVDPDLASSEPEMKLGDDEVQSQFDSEDQEEMLVVMVDPDAPSDDPCPQTYYLHWITLAKLKGGVVIPQKEIVQYKGPTPPPDTGVHRYQLLLYSLDGKGVESSELAAPDRSGFDLQGFQNSVGLDEPVASFQFKAEN